MQNLKPIYEETQGKSVYQVESEDVVETTTDAVTGETTSTTTTKKYVVEYQIKRFVRQDMSIESIDQHINNLNSTVTELETIKSELTSSQ